MTERESIIGMMSPREIEYFLASGASIPPRSWRVIRRRFGEFLLGKSDDEAVRMDWEYAIEAPEIPAAPARPLAIVEAA